MFQLVFCSFLLLTQNTETALRARITELEAQLAWKPVASWNGVTAKTTEKFTVEGKEWRINWKFAGEPVGAILQITVHDSMGKVVHISTNPFGSGSDVLPVNTGPYYLQINSTGSATWQIGVESR